MDHDAVHLVRQLVAVVPPADESLQARLGLGRQEPLELLERRGADDRGNGLAVTRDHVPGLIRLSGIELELSGLLGGRKVDLNTLKTLSPYFRDDVLREARFQYVAA